MIPVEVLKDYLLGSFLFLIQKVTTRKQNFQGKHLRGLPEASITINVTLALIPDHIKLSATPQVIPKGNTSTIEAIVYDYFGKIVSNYTGYITFTTDLGTFNGDTSVYTANGIAEIGLFSDSSGSATIEASLVYNDILKESKEAVVVEFYGDSHHIELNASPDMVKTVIGNTSTITATVCDLNSIHVPEYTGYITFTKTPPSFGTFSGDNPVYTTNGTATIELSSEAVGTATITASDGTILSNNICEVEFYDETTLTLVDNSVIYNSTDKTVTFDVKATGENIEVDEMEVSWAESASQERFNKIVINGEEVYANGNDKSGQIVDIIDKLLTAGGEYSIKITFAQDMTGRDITVVFYPLIGSYTVELF